MHILAPISVGELIDKITILEIKLTMLTNPAQLDNVAHELKELEQLAQMIPVYTELAALKAELKQVNLDLWHIENYKRACEQSQTFTDGFVNAARQVYLKNDLRAKIKRTINELTNSSIVEEKSHSTV